MANDAPRRDYLYVSTQEVERVVATLPEPLVTLALPLTTGLLNVITKV